ncbi:hypothetical protein JTB14_010031 [Gonioctena quinquepunctata]|nr:hypothetical protein JTB14_010031 [Gonioctena quinquepunctata]
MLKNAAWFETLKTTIEHYLTHSSIPGYKYLNGKFKFGRYIWYMVHMLSLAFTFFMINYTWTNFMVSPTVTTLESFSYPLNGIPMPGISVCNINKISKARAEKSAKSGRPSEEIFANISLLGRLYEYRLPFTPDDLIHFQDFLDQYDGDSDGFFNVYDCLKELSIPCTELLMNCLWQERDRNCSHLFVTELTMEGHCCVFNYLSQKSTTSISPIINENHNRSVTFGQNGHLSFKIFANTSDFLYKTLNTEAIAKRDCIFRDEILTVFGNYSYSDCIMDCKIKSIVALCQCIPFNYKNVFQNNPYYQCTLADLHCLDGHAGKWKTMYPTNYHGDSLEREKQDSLSCKSCYPACSDTLYDVSSDSAEIFINGEKAGNFSVVHVVLEKSVGPLNKQDVFFYWYDMIGIFGGICSLTMGLNFMSLFEIIYFFIWIFTNKNVVKKLENVETSETMGEIDEIN